MPSFTPNADTGLLVAECPEIGAASQGETEARALETLRETTQLYLESFPQAVSNQTAVRTFELAIPSPAWHGELLAARVERVTKGEAEFREWPDVKERLLRKKA